MKTTITPELIRSALQYVSANLPRDEWARVGMAIKSEFPDDTGRDLFNEWSATADSYDAKATGATWRSIKAGGGVSIGTLLHLAKENGFTLPKADQAASTPDPETVARLARERTERQQAEQVRQQAAHDQAAIEAAALWAQASETGDSPYLTRKGVQPFGVRFAADGWLLVPVRDASGSRRENPEYEFMVSASRERLAEVEKHYADALKLIECDMDPSDLQERIDALLIAAGCKPKSQTIEAEEIAA